MDSDDRVPGTGLLSRISGPARRREMGPLYREGGLELPFSPEEVLRQLPDGAAVAGASGRITWANDELGRLLGRSARELIGQSASMIAGPYAGDREGLLILEFLRAGEGELETTAVSHAGTSTPCLLRVRRLGSDESASRLVVLSEMTQISAMRAALAARSELQQRERTILDNVARSLQDGIVVLDDTERVVLSNESARRLLDLGEDTSRGRALVDLPLPSPLRGEWLAFLASCEPSSTQTLTITSGGRRRTLLLQFGRSATVSGAPVGSVLLVRDLSSIRRSDRTRTDAMRQITHELRTPMQSIQGFAEVISRDPDLPEETRAEFCRSIEQESRRLGQAVETLLAMAGRGPVSEITDRRTRDLRPIVEEGVEQARVALSRPEKSVRLSMPDQTLSAWIDASRLARVIQEITVNALLHGTSPAGVEIRVRRVEDSITIEVRDWGRGVPAEQLEEVFDPFFRLSGELSTERAMDAYAFGLPFCRQVAESHGGVIRAELPRGGGLRIVLELPSGE